MKNKKIVPILTLSIVALGAIVGCNSSNSPKDEPAVHLYALSENGYFKNDQCIKYSIEGDKLEYGKEVNIHIQPKRWFRLGEFDQESWEPIEHGSYAKPFVGLGSPTNKYSYPLTEHVAYEYIKESQEGDDQESFKLTVKAEAFQKNLIIDFGSREGDENNRVKEIKSTYYRDMMLNSDHTFTKESHGAEDPKAKTHLHNKVKFSKEMSNFSAAAGSMILTYELPTNNAYSNALMSFQGLDEIGGDTGQYSNLIVEGTLSDETGTEILSDTKWKDDEGNKLFNVKLTNSFRTMVIYIDWDLLISDNKDYNYKYSSIDLYFNPTYRSTVKFQPSSGAEISAMTYGYCNEKETDAWYMNYDDPTKEEPVEKGEEYVTFHQYEVFKPARFAIPSLDKTGKTDSYYTYFYNCSVDVAGKDHDEVDNRAYFAAFKYGQYEDEDKKDLIKWPDVSISYAKKGESTLTYKFDTENPITTTNRGDKDPNNITYCLSKNKLWQLICVNTKDRRDGIPYKTYFDNHNYFVIVPVVGTSAFKYANTNTYADIAINVR